MILQIDPRWQSYVRDRLQGLLYKKTAFKTDFWPQEVPQPENACKWKCQFSGSDQNAKKNCISNYKHFWAKLLSKLILDLRKGPNQKAKVQVFWFGHFLWSKFWKQFCSKVLYNYWYNFFFLLRVSDQWAANCACAWQTKINKFWRIKPNKPGKKGNGLKTGIFRQKQGKTCQKTGETTGETGQKKQAKTGKQNRTLAKQGETECFAEFWFGIATPCFGRGITKIKKNKNAQIMTGRIPLCPPTHGNRNY